MKLTNKIAVDSIQSLNHLSELKLPVKTAFKLAKIIRKTNEVLETYNEVLKKLQQNYVEKDEDGNAKTLDDPDNPDIKRFIFSDPNAFSVAYKELLEIEIELDITKLQIEELANIEVTPATLYSIDWLIEN